MAACEHDKFVIITHNNRQPPYPHDDVEIAAAIAAATAINGDECKKNEGAGLYVAYLGERKHEDPNLVTASHHELLTRVLGSKEDAIGSTVYSYRHGFSGFAAMLTDSEAKKIADLPEVITITLDHKVHAHTTRSWDFLGLNYYSQHEGLLHKANHGEDIIIGVIDSGIWPESRSFDDTGYGPIPSRWRGKCQVGEAFSKKNCNRKIIGARWYAGGARKEDLNADYKSPRGLAFHGTHTASTAAGNLVANVSFHGISRGTVRGGAPKARLAIYKTLWGEGRGSGADQMKAIDDAIHDGVDILSLSMEGNAGLPLLPYAALHAVANGITVVYSAGNIGPAPQTVENDSPWVITVAASTVDRSYPTLITLGDGQKLWAQSFYYGVNRDYNFTELVTIDDGCDDKLLNRTDIAGKVILCSPADITSSIPKVDIPIVGNSALEAGVNGVIFADYGGSLLDFTINDKIPYLLIDFEVKARITNYTIATSGTPMVKIKPARTAIGSEVLAPKVAGFSSRGPSPSFPGLLKPDITAPGVSILAAAKDSYSIDSGTSMSCPHVSGVAALLKSLHPNWSPAAIKSALVTTASVTNAYGEPIEAESVPRKLADPFDFGGGHIDPNRAADPGLIYDINPKDYFKFFECGSTFCLQNGILDNLNLPSIAIPDLRNDRTVSRTVTNVGGVHARYKAVAQAPPGVKMVVEPSALYFDASIKIQTFTITFTPTRKVQGDFKFGSLTWVEDNEKHSVRIPIAVRTVIYDNYADIF